MLLGRLSEFGITGTVWNWFKSYLTPISQMNACSDATFLKLGVPQGSVLGPVLFTLYTIPLGEICRRREVFYHLYADDTQFFFTFSVGNVVELEEARRRIQNCISEIKMWMSFHFLKLNDDKTEVILITPRSNHNKISLPTIKVGNSDVTPSKLARNIGGMFDANMSMATQITTMCRSAWYQLRNIREVRHSLTTEATIRLVCALVFLRIDYGNILLYGAPGFLLQKLQRVQNSAARLVTKWLRSDHITPILRELHWLPVKQRIQYKLLVTSYKALHGSAPSYLSEMLQPYQSTRTLRSNELQLFHVPRARCGYGDRSSAVAAPRLLNSIPLVIKSCTLPFSKIV